MITRRCSERRNFLRPSDDTNALIPYVLAVAAERHGIRLHGFTFMSNHCHIALTDPLAELPAFDQYVNGIIARAMNHRLRRTEAFWAPGSYNEVVLVNPEDAFDKLAYILANPVSAGLVPRAAEWPGVWTPPELIGAGPMTVKRPDWYFRDDGPMPETATLELFLPTCFDSPEHFRVQLAAELAQREEGAAQRMARERRSFMGAARVLAEDPFSGPRTTEPRLKLKPRIGCLDPVMRLEAIARLRTFLAAHRAAWLAFAAGLREFVFPYGTYEMRVAYGVRCEAPA
jgi:REP element-mobilizing transposase RayT